MDDYPRVTDSPKSIKYEERRTIIRKVNDPRIASEFKALGQVKTGVVEFIEDQVHSKVTIIEPTYCKYGQNDAQNQKSKTFLTTRCYICFN